MTVAASILILKYLEMKLGGMTKESGIPAFAGMTNEASPRFMDEGGQSRRHVGPLLATAIFAVPAILVWVLLRKGYAPSTRRAAFLYAGAITAFGVLGGR